MLYTYDSVVKYMAWCQPHPKATCGTFQEDSLALLYLANIANNNFLTGNQTSKRECPHNLHSISSMTFSDLAVHSHFGFELRSPDCCSLDLTSDLLCLIFPPNTDGALLAGNRAVSNPVRIICLLYKLLTVTISLLTSWLQNCSSCSIDPRMLDTRLHHTHHIIASNWYTIYIISLCILTCTLQNSKGEQSSSNSCGRQDILSSIKFIVQLI